MQLRMVFSFPIAAMMAAGLFAGPCLAQNSDFNLDVHAHSHATAKQIGLPEYPGATPYKDKDNDSTSADLGLILNSFQFSIQAASYVTTDPPEQVLRFYRKPLSKYGEVLECDRGKAVGELTKTKSGLTCGDGQHGKVSVNGTGDDDLELRAGTPQQMRIVGIDSSKAGKTKFGLVALVLPKDSDN